MTGRALAIDDRELAGLVSSGDVRGALAALHRAHDGDVRRLVTVVAKGSARVDDVCQDVWKAVLEGLPSFRFECASRAWVLAIARRRAVDVHRRRVPVQSVDSQMAHAGPLGALLGQRTVRTPSGELHAAAKQRTLWEAMEALSPDERELLELRYVVGLKPAEIVGVLGLSASANTVSQRIVRLLHKLRVELAEKEELASVAR